jgi:hypothetical protein
MMMKTIWDDCTPEEQQILKSATFRDWMTAIVSCIKDANFWKQICISFFEGMKRGFEKHR